MQSKVSELETEKQNLVEEVVSLQELLSAAKSAAVATAASTLSTAATPTAETAPPTSPVPSVALSEEELTKIQGDLKRIRAERNQLKVHYFVCIVSIVTERLPVVD